MASYLRRGKVSNLGSISIILWVYSTFPLVLFLTGKGFRNGEGSVNTIFIVFLAIAAPLALLSALPLIFFWRKDRNVDRYFLSTATSRQLVIIMTATAGVGIATASLIAAEVVEIVEYLRANLYWNTVFSTIIILLLCWIAQDTITMLMHVNRCRSEVLEIEMAVGNREQENKDQPALAPPSYV